MDAELRSPAGVVRDSRARDHRLGRCAAVVDAGTTQVLALQQRHLLTQVCELVRQRRAALSSADNDCVVASQFSLLSIATSLSPRRLGYGVGRFFLYRRPSGSTQVVSITSSPVKYGSCVPRLTFQSLNRNRHWHANVGALRVTALLDSAHDHAQPPHRLLQ